MTVRDPIEEIARAQSMLAEFAATTDDDFKLDDLRTAPIGMRFSCGRYGRRTELRRHRYHRAFAYRRPPRPPHRLRGPFTPRRRPA